MPIIICPGIHDSQLTEEFLEAVFDNWRSLQESGNLLIFPTRDYPAYSGIDIFNFLWYESDRTSESRMDRSWLFIGFSAGVVGAIAAAWKWRFVGGKVKGFVAADGWGVPLGGDFPIYRMSHDRFTHWSSAWLRWPTKTVFSPMFFQCSTFWGPAMGENRNISLKERPIETDESFYADPGVGHLDLWRSPQRATGWWLHKFSGVETASPATAAEFAIEILRKHGELKYSNY